MERPAARANKERFNLHLDVEDLVEGLRCEPVDSRSIEPGRGVPRHKMARGPAFAHGHSRHCCRKYRHCCPSVSSLTKLALTADDGARRVPPLCWSSVKSLEWLPPATSPRPLIGRHNPTNLVANTF